MNIVHLMASPFLGGPERQVLGLAEGHSAGVRTIFLSFPEGDRCRPFIDEAHRRGFETHVLVSNHPHLRTAAREVAGHLQRLGADVLCCAGYKPDIVGWWASRMAGVPVVAVAHGWTAATLKVRINEALDRMIMRRMDAVVCVSEAQAVKVRRARVPHERVHVIRNAVQRGIFANPDPADRALLEGLFPKPPKRIVGAVGRLSPEKGYEQFVAAAAIVARSDPEVGFVLFGDGPLRSDLESRIAALSLQSNFILGGFRTDLHCCFPHFDVAVLPSYTEGLPVMVLEAFASRVPVVATAVGGTPEVIEDGINGYLVPPRQPIRLAERILDLLRNDDLRNRMGASARRRVEQHFDFTHHAQRYEQLFEDLKRVSVDRPLPTNRL